MAFPRAVAIREITSVDASVTITDPDGPTTDLSVMESVGTITEITSDDGSVTIVDPNGPSTDLSVTTGLVFDLDPQVGDFLDLEVTAGNIDLVAPGTDPEGWINLDGVLLVDPTLQGPPIVNPVTQTAVSFPVTGPTPISLDQASESIPASSNVDVFNQSQPSFCVLTSDGLGDSQVVIQVSVNSGAYVNFQTCDIPAMVALAFGNIRVRFQNADAGSARNSSAINLSGVQMVADVLPKSWFQVNPTINGTEVWVPVFAFPEGE